jgi:hypothetical protein
VAGEPLTFQTPDKSGVAVADFASPGGCANVGDGSASAAMHAANNIIVRARI